MSQDLNPFKNQKQVTIRKDIVETAVKMIKQLEEKFNIKPFVDTLQNGLRLAINTEELVNAIINDAKRRMKSKTRDVDVKGYTVSVGNKTFIIFDIVSKGEAK